MIGMIRKPHQIKRESNNGKERNKRHDEGVRRRLLWLVGGEFEFPSGAGGDYDEL